MGCIINNINNISIINDCQFVIGGIKRLWVSNFSSGLYNSLTFNQLGIITSLNSPVVFSEILYIQSGTKYNETYNYSDRKYDQSIDLEIAKYSYDKREYIDSLIKAKLTFIFQDYQGKYYILGEKNGVYSSSYSATTDVFSGKSSYIYKFSMKSDYGLLGISDDLIPSLTEVDCSILDDELALSSTLFINKYYNCLIGDLPDFINP